MDLARSCDVWFSGHARDGLLPLPVEQKTISKLLGDARDRLFPMPVKEKAFPSLPQALPKCPRASEALEVPELINIVLLSFGLWRTSEIGKSGLPKPDSPGARDGLRTRVRWTAFSECS